MHPDDEQLQRFLHRELNADSRRSVSEHLVTCGNCRERLFDLERDQKEVYRLLQRVDSPPPAITAAEVAAAARASRFEWGRLAAGILLAVGLAGGAYAMPGSPLRDWIRGARDTIQGSERPPTPVEPPMPLMAGLAVPPGERLVILFERAHPQSQARVSIGDWTEVRVRGPSGGATFGSEADTLRVGNRDSTATFEIEIPRDARKVEIRVAGTRIFAKDGPRIVAQGAGGTEKVYLLSLAP
jgi:hypothetical protein